jgi:TonB family protein
MTHNTLRLLFLCLVIGFVPSVPADQESDLAALKEAFSRYEESYKQGYWATSLPEAKSAYELGMRLLGPESPETAKFNYNYGNNLLKTKNYAEAKTTLSEALTRFELVYGSDSVELLPVLMDLGHANAKMGNTRAKTKLYKQAFNLSEDNHGASSVEHAWFSVNAGSDILRVAQDKDGEKHLRKGYESLQSELGENDPRVGFAAYNLGAYELAMSNYQAAKRYLLAALASFEQPEKPSNKMELSTHAYLVRVYEEMGDSESATFHSLAIGRMTPFESAQEYFPLYKRPPVYPRAALRERQEAAVVVEFTVDEKGFVKDPIVVWSNGPKIFDQPSLDAVIKFRYAPRFIDGKPVSVKRVQNKLTYSINQ